MKSNGWLWLGVGCLGVTVALAGRCGLLPPNWWLAPWILSLVLFGLPHGAIDHDVLLRLWRPPPAPRWSLPAILAGYTAASLLVIGAWFVAPTIVFGGFILLTWAHWGLADLWWSWRRDPGYFSSRGHRLVFAAWRGGLPMLVPLAFDPGMYRQTAQAVCNLFLRQPADFYWLELDVTRAVALGLALILGTTDALLATPAARTRWSNLAEGAGLLVFFSLVPALAAVGFYFAFWHGWRHVRRLMVWEGLGWGGFARKAAPATVGALAMLAGLAWVTPHRPTSLSWVGVYLALISALTVPHALVVAVQDVRDGLWRRE